MLNKTTKRVLALLLSLLIVFSIPMMAYAATPKLHLNLSKDKIYSGVTYEVNARVDGLSADQVLDVTSTAFDWSITEGSSIFSTNNYKYAKAADGTYTASETAKFTVSGSVGETITIEAKYGSDSVLGDVSFSVLQPITNIDLTCTNESSDVKFIKSGDESDDALYVNDKTTANFTADVKPLHHDDSIFVSATKASTVSIKGTSFEFTPGNSTKAADLSFDMKVAPSSGYKYQKTVKVTRCVPLTKFTLSNGVDTINSYSKTSGNEKYASMNVVQDESFSLTAKKISPSYSNDIFNYKLYNVDSAYNIIGPADSSYMTVDKSYNVSLNIHNPGLYLLECENASAGNILSRNLKAAVFINVTESNPATNIELRKVDTDGNITAEELQDLDLYLNVNSATYDLSQSIVVRPEGYTDSIIYLTDNEKVATVDRTTGLITAVGKGDTRIYAVSSRNTSVVASLDVHVFVGVNAITGIQKKTATLPAGHSEQLTAVVNPSQHDETISWASMNPKALTVTQNGYVTANPNYDFGNSDAVLVGVTATSQFGKTFTTYIQVVPAIRASKIDIKVGKTAELQKDDSYFVFSGTPFDISAVATSSFGAVSNDELVWRVSLSDGRLYDLETATDIFSKISKNPDGSYTLTPKISDTIAIHCYAVLGGSGITFDSVYQSVAVRVSGRATKLVAINPDTKYSTTSLVMSANTSTDLQVSMAPATAYTDDAFTCDSDNDAICTVVKTGVQSFRLTSSGTAGTAKITLKSKSGSKSTVLKVTVNRNIAYASVVGLENEYVYTGSRIEPSPTIKANGLTLYKDEDYTLSYSNQTNVGIAKLTITGKGDFAGSKLDLYYNIVQKDLGSGKPSADVSATVLGTYTLGTSKSVTPRLTVKYGKFTLKEGTDYNIVCRNNTAAGTGIATVNGIGNYSGTFDVEFTIKDSISNAVVKNIPSVTCTGKALTPVVQLTYHGRRLTQGVDYKLSYYSNVSVGQGKVTIYGLGVFSGTVQASFNILPKAPKGVRIASVSGNSIRVSWTKDTTMSGYQILNAKTNKIVATVKGTQNTYTVSRLGYGSQYSFKVRAYKGVGGKNYYGVYSGTASAYTKPKGTSLKKLKAKSKAFAVYWNKQTSKTNGYQLQYSTNKSFKNAKTLTVSNTKTTSKTISKLSKKKVYYVRVRTYKTIGKTKIYSSWSGWKSVKTK